MIGGPFDQNGFRFLRSERRDEAAGHALLHRESPAAGRNRRSAAGSQRGAGPTAHGAGQVRATFTRSPRVVFAFPEMTSFGVRVGSARLWRFLAFRSDSWRRPSLGVFSFFVTGFFLSASKEKESSPSPKFIVTLEGVPSPLENLAESEMELEDVRPPPKAAKSKVGVLQRLRGGPSLAGLDMRPMDSSLGTWA